jgi:hypothetical protein
MFVSFSMTQTKKKPPHRVPVNYPEYIHVWYIIRCLTFYFCKAGVTKYLGRRSNRSKKRGGPHHRNRLQGCLLGLTISYRTC